MIANRAFSLTGIAAILMALAAAAVSVATQQWYALPWQILTATGFTGAVLYERRNAALMAQLMAQAQEPPWDSAEGVEVLSRLRTSNPALFAQIQSDRERKLSDDAPGQDEERPAEAGPLHAHEVTEQDAGFIRLMSGAHFGDQVRVTLPSGRTVTGAEMRRWVEGQQD